MCDDLISRQAAIDAVRELYIQSPKINNDIVYDTAIDQAHDALVNLPSAQPESAKRTAESAQNVSDGDLISRKAAIDALSISRGILYPIRAIESLPSAQPEKRTEERTETHACDCVDRQAAINVVFSEPLYESGMKKRSADVVVPVIYEKIKSLPPAQPQRMRAKWIATTSIQEGQITWRDYKCSSCSHHREKPMNFCEVCGAKMER